MLKIYAGKQGGKHRDTPEAKLWRTTTSQVAQGLRIAYPKLLLHRVLESAEYETERMFRSYNWAAKQRIAATPATSTAHWSEQ